MPFCVLVKEVELREKSQWKVSQLCEAYIDQYNSAGIVESSCTEFLYTTNRMLAELLLETEGLQ